MASPCITAGLKPTSLTTATASPSGPWEQMREGHLFGFQSPLTLEAGTLVQGLTYTAGHGSPPPPLLPAHPGGEGGFKCHPGPKADPQMHLWQALKALSPCGGGPSPQQVPCHPAFIPQEAQASPTPRDQPRSLRGRERPLGLCQPPASPQVTGSPGGDGRRSATTLA